MLGSKAMFKLEEFETKVKRVLLFDLCVVLKALFLKLDFLGFGWRL